MAEISISLNILDDSGAIAEIAGQAPLQQSLPNLVLAATASTALTGGIGQAALLEQSLLLHSRPLKNVKRTLHDLGVYTGDVLTIWPRHPERNSKGGGPEMLEIVFNIVPDRGDLLEVSDDVPLADLVGALTAFARRERYTVQHREYMLCFGRVISNLAQTPLELGLRPGDLLSLVRVRLRPSRVTLALISPRKLHPPIRINASPAVLGQSHQMPSGTSTGNLHLGTPPDIDLAALLPAEKVQFVAYRHAEFNEEQGVWSVSLSAEASLPLWVNDQRVDPQRPMILTDDQVLSFGNAPNQPDLQLIVAYETD
jgi:hypothetical protein